MLVTIFVPGHVHLLEIAGIRDALFEANCKMEASRHYQVRLVTEQGQPEASASGVVFLPDAGMRDAASPCDTLIVLGPFGVPSPLAPDTAQWLRVQAGQARRYGSVCTGAFVLAQAGLLAGRKATTHWQYAERLAAEFPDIIVEPDRIFVRDGPVFTSAGVTAALDLALALIEEDHGAELALWVARRLVVFLKRPGGQSQFSAALSAQTGTTSPTDRIRMHVMENPRADLGLPALAAVARVSPRHLSRLFRAELGLSAAAYVELTRVDIARRLLEDSAAPIKAIAFAAGFGSVTTLRRAFQRIIGISPLEYRLRFQTTGPQFANDADAADLSQSAA